MSWRWKSSRKLVAATGAKRKGRAVRPGLKEAPSETRESTHRNRMSGAASRGERPNARKAPATKDERRISGDCAGTLMTLTWGDLASCLKGQRPPGGAAE